MIEQMYQLWQSVPPEARLGITGVAVKYLVDVVRKYAPSIDGKGPVMALCGLLAFVLAVLQAALMGGVSNGYLTMFAGAIASLLVAVGYHHATDKSA